MRSERVAADRHRGRVQCGTRAIPASAPCLAKMANGMMHGVPDFLELHARPAHPNERDERREHFVRPLADVIDPRIAQHAFEWQVGEVRRAAVDLERVVDDLPQRLGREDLQHRRLDHVILQPAIDERRGDGRHRLHRVGARRHARDLLFHQLEIAERVAELTPRPRVMRGEAQAGLRRAGAARAESRAAKIEHAERDLQPFAQRAEDVFAGHWHVAEGEASRGGAADAEFFHARFGHGKARHVRRDEERGDGRLVAAGNFRAGHDGEDLRDRRVGDVALLAVQNVMRAVRAQFGARLDIGGIGAGLRLGERERGKLFAADEWREPAALLLRRAEEQQRPDADGVMRIYEHRRGSTARSDLLEHATVGHLRKSAPAEFERCRHAEHAEPREAVNHLARDVRVSINGRGIEFLVEEPAQLRQHGVELLALLRGHRGIGHHPVGGEAAEEQPLRDAEPLRAGEEQFLRVVDLLFVRLGVRRAHGAFSK